MIVFIADIIIALCLFVLFTSIIINFAEAGGKPKEKRRSVVATATMTIFFIGYYALIRFRVGEIALGETLSLILPPLGAAIIVFGTAVNVMGRLHLGRNWADQATLYKGQTLVTVGPYRYVRHPLYASLMWMFYGALLVHPNYSAFLATTFIFVPAMVYRARLEERILEKEFKDYKRYRKEVGMFFPKIQ